jgi:hypothetical protein
MAIEERKTVSLYPQKHNDLKTCKEILQTELGFKLTLTQTVEILISKYLEEHNGSSENVSNLTK